MLNISDERTIELIKVCQEEAELSIATDNSPFGCVITDLDGNILVQAHNTQKSDSDPTAHAEINALRQLGKQKGALYLDNCVLLSNAESCSMCVSAAIKAHILHFYYGAPAEGSMDPLISMRDIAAKSKEPVEIHGPILAEDCAEQIIRGRSAMK